MLTMTVTLTSSSQLGWAGRMFYIATMVAEYSLGSRTRTRCESAAVRADAPGPIMITTGIWICLWLISGRKAFSTVITVTGRLPWSATVVLARKQAIPGVGPGLILIMTGTSIFS